MLDKSIPYVNMHMLIPREDAQKIAVRDLPQGYRYKLYEPGDEAQWAKIETAVLEFPCEEKALEYFAKNFAPYPEELARRCWFILDENGNYCATTTAWYSDAEPRQGMVHWVSCLPGYQGKGLGKSIVMRALVSLCELENSDTFMLHTQTWSHKAVGLYMSLGFRLKKEEPSEDGKTGYDHVLNALRGVMPETYFGRLVETAI